MHERYNKLYVGRNRFMGYFKNEEENKKTIDRKGFVHSGDEGKIRDVLKDEVPEELFSFLLCS